MMILAAGLLSFGCHSKKDLISHDGTDNYLADAAGLKVAMAVSAVNNSRQAVYLTFTVTNNSDREVRFVKWETPFEPRLGKYFEIVDHQGNEVVFKGAMARRVMPPPVSAYIVVKPHDQVSTRVDLADTYTFNGGHYQLRYVGGGVSGLQTRKSLKFTIAH